MEMENPTGEELGEMFNAINLQEEKQLPLTEEQREEFTEAFAKYSDNDGYITIEKLKMAMKSLGRNPTEKDVVDIFKVFDADQDGRIILAEFLNLMVQYTKDFDWEEELLDVFKVLDLDGKDYVCAEEFWNMMTTEGELLTNEEVVAIKKIAEVNDNTGRIDYPEFVKKMLAKSYCKDRPLDSS